jgi:hypothetical protein
LERLNAPEEDGDDDEEEGADLHGIRQLKVLCLKSDRRPTYCYTDTNPDLCSLVHSACRFYCGGCCSCCDACAC